MTEKYSFSRLETFHNCKRAFYNDYVIKQRGGDNVYSYCGTVTHELAQGIIQDTETNDGAVSKFIEAIDEMELMGLEWMSDKVRDNYVEAVTHFLNNYNPDQNDTYRIEDYFEIEIGGYVLRGYIDLWYRVGRKIYIVDYKTSTKFSAKDLPKKSRQLILYGIHLSEKYPDYEIILQFNMMKYVLKKGKLYERVKLDIFDEDYPDGILEVNYTDEAVMEVKEYVTNTIKQIKQMSDNKNEWTMDKDPKRDFFCKNLCGHRLKCLSEI